MKPTKPTRRETAAPSPPPLVAPRSAPNPDRPKLPSPYEEQLAALDNQSAACYSAIEDASDRIAQLVKSLDESSYGIVIPSDFDEDDSLVHHIDAIASPGR
jgi:hypothetical protein